MIVTRGSIQVALSFFYLAATRDGAASAASIKFCFKTNGDFADSGFSIPGGATEDNWTVNEPRNLRGAKTVVKIGTTTYFDGTLGDGLGTGDPGAGCTTTMTVPVANSTYQFNLYSSDGRIDNLAGGQHILNAKVDDDDGTVHDVNLITIWQHVDGPGSFDVALNGGDNQATKLWRVHAASAYFLRRMARWADPVQADVFMDEDEDARNKYDDGDVLISASASPIGVTRKYVIAHEFGHLLADAHANAVHGNCDLSDSECPAGGDHGMSSKEYQSCAFTEGVAHFFAAATWNEFESGGESDCIFRYWSDSTIDCEGSLTSSWPEAYMETNCSSSSHTDRGVELDWLRQFWDVKVDGSNPQFSDVMNWLTAGYFVDIPPGWDDPYFRLDQTSDGLGGGINTNWDNSKGTNGIDW